MGRSVQSYVPHSVMGSAEYNEAPLASKLAGRELWHPWFCCGAKFPNLELRRGLSLLAKLFRCLDEGFDQRRVIKPSDGNGYL
jgi:hypothetical protein